MLASCVDAGDGQEGKGGNNNPVLFALAKARRMLGGCTRGRELINGDDHFRPNPGHWRELKPFLQAVGAGLTGQRLQLAKQRSLLSDPTTMSNGGGAVSCRT